MLIIKELTIAIDIVGKKLCKSMATINCMVTKYLLLCSEEQKNKRIVHPKINTDLKSGASDTLILNKQRFTHYRIYITIKSLDFL